MEYKVVKEFGSAKKGDILEQDGDMFCFEITEDNTIRSMAIDPKSATNLVEKGYLEVVEDITAEDKLDKIYKRISYLLDGYEDAAEEIKRAYENKEIPACVKVEAETVYYNMNKVLKAIKDIIDE